GRVPILIGGASDEAIERTVRWGVGWISGGGGPAMASPFAERVRKAWKEAGRAGAPRIMALNYYALGDRPEAAQGGYLRDYYGAAPWVDQMLQYLPRTPDAAREAARG